jgi:hypothetical protein
MVLLSKAGKDYSQLCSKVVVERSYTGLSGDTYVYVFEYTTYTAYATLFGKY